MDDEETSREIEQRLDSVEQEHKADRAYEMLIAGDTYKQIADKVGYSSAAVARRAIQEMFNTQVSDISSAARTDALHLALERLRTLWNAVYYEAATGDPKAVVAALAVMDRMIKLQKLDVPDATTEQAQVLVIGEAELDYVAKLKAMTEDG